MKRINTRRIKVKLSYYIPDLAELLHVHPNTILGWIKNEGLQRNEGIYPYMLYGEVVIAFLKARKNKNKITLQHDEFRCCKCKAARKAKGRTAAMHSSSSKKAMLRAICNECSGAMCKIISLKNKAEIENLLIIQTPHHLALVQSTHSNTHLQTKRY